MPQLDTTMFLTQYRWTLLVLFLLFFLLVFFVLPTIKMNWLIRKSAIKSGANLGDCLGLTKEVVCFCRWKVYM
ncbi:ATP synthase F0 subunit 8 (mitochondrion) [Acropora digitifera]|uniref:ATP synthase F0 subunit 8 n=19 Tax=Acropora TaxID=6127 RepID=A0A8K1ZJE3_ACRCE|nr:ATP synthase F0 subunit 8 [Acropora tenuis]YP_008815385.1 ATP synthase F0 subunit 8 [Acropora humilis]YP_008815398.1 ATP synthase F0 subunit 8 [Acropora muricata]YP_008815411.1 ATP synthase F0 subunit 8 [Acropora horrida]YP_008815424.1 ATP synthase F0 subunit 8 [Acropora hyacinthus]YP_008815437.1 ATP synthase F0 subunit 8 [Acropora aspera]YP_008815450.1 ATP synthase F0 subunit 8 [Acropora florida]YP_008815463.1 ATP synthase F0 subunit 8 [Acropora yongei]YP_008815476.1 ATP synthase F0 sub